MDLAPVEQPLEWPVPRPRTQWLNWPPVGSFVYVTSLFPEGSSRPTHVNLAYFRGDILYYCRLRIEHPPPGWEPTEETEYEFPLNPPGHPPWARR